MAGMAMNPTRLGLAHALAMPLGSWDLKIPHSVAIAVTLPVVMEFNCTAAPERFVAVAPRAGRAGRRLRHARAGPRARRGRSGASRTRSGFRQGSRGSACAERHVAEVVDEAMKSGNVAVNPRAHEPGSSSRRSCAGRSSDTSGGCKGRPDAIDNGRRQNRVTPVLSGIVRRCPWRTIDAEHAAAHERHRRRGACRRPAAPATPFATRPDPRECLGEFADSTKRGRDAAVDAAAGRRGRRGRRHPALSGAPSLFRFAELLEAARTELARIVTLEQGKALAEAMGEVGRAAAEARFMAGEASRPAGLDVSERAAGIVLFTVAEPLGVDRGDLSVEFPGRHAGPEDRARRSPGAIPSSSSRPSLTPWSAVYLMELLERAGLPPGVVNLVTGSGAVVGEALIHDARVRGISFTGSTKVGTTCLRSGRPPAGARAARAGRQEPGSGRRL